MSKQPEALRLATFCDGNAIYQPAAAELRRQHALIAELVEALEASLIGLSAAQGNRCANLAAHQARAAISKAKDQQ